MNILKATINCSQILLVFDNNIGEAMSKNKPSNDINEQKGKLEDNGADNVAISSIKEENVNKYKEYDKGKLSVSNCRG